MKLRLVRAGLVLVGNALGLWIAALILGDGMSVSGVAFVIAVVLFTLLTLIFDQVVSRLAEKYADYLSALSALISTALALLVTDWISDGLSIDGIGTWLLATLLVWAVTAIVGVLLGRIVLRKVAAQ